MTSFFSMIAYFVMPCNGAEIFKAAKIGVCIAELPQNVRTAQKTTLCRDMKFLSNILAPKFHRCQFCFSLDTLVVIEIDIIINQLSCFS